MKLDTRQKILIPLIIIAFVYIGWQVYQMLYASPTKTASTPVTMIKPTAPTPPKLPEVGPSRVPQKGNIQELAPGKETSQSAAYQHLMKTYQELEAERMLLQEEMAIAETKQKIASLQTKLNHMSGTKTTIAATSPKKQTYKLMFIDHQDGHKWSAALNDSNKVFHEVSIGSTLPDGSKVIAIDNTGVTIKKDQQLTRLTFTGAHPIAIMPGPVIIKKSPPKSTKLTQKKTITKTKVAYKKPAQHTLKKKCSKPKITAKKAPVKVKKTKPTALAPNYTVRSVQTGLRPNYKLRPVAATSKKPKPTTKVVYKKPVTKKKPKPTKKVVQKKTAPKKVTQKKPVPKKKAIYKKKPDVDMQPIMFSPLPPKPAAVPNDY